MRSGLRPGDLALSIFPGDGDFNIVRVDFPYFYLFPLVAEGDSVSSHLPKTNDWADIPVTGSVIAGDESRDLYRQAWSELADELRSASTAPPNSDVHTVNRDGVSTIELSFRHIYHGILLNQRQALVKKNGALVAVIGAEVKQDFDG
jgi:hypothetical protein